jgi:VWFA-related protein
MPWLALAALLALPQTPLPQTPLPQIPVIRVPVRLVRVPALVFAPDGKVIPGLEPRDFQLFDDGRPQRFTLDTGYLPPSVAVVVQVSAQVRQYLPFIARVGSAVQDLLVGETGQAALITYEDFVEVRKDFSGGDMREAFHKVTEGGRRARMIDAALAAVDLLRQEPLSRSRVLLLIGQAMDHGSRSKLAELVERAQRENVTVYALALPQFNKAFVEDTFSLEALSSRTDRGGFKAGADLSKLAPALTAAAEVSGKDDPFTSLTRITGGTQLHFRNQRALEDAVGIVGTELRSVYTLSFTPDAPHPGYHSLKLEVNVPGATPYARRGYVD